MTLDGRTRFGQAGNGQERPAGAAVHPRLGAGRHAIGGTVLAGRDGHAAGALSDVLVPGLIQTLIAFDGALITNRGTP